MKSYTVKIVVRKTDAERVSGVFLGQDWREHFWTQDLKQRAIGENYIILHFPNVFEGGVFAFQELVALKIPFRARYNIVKEQRQKGSFSSELQFNGIRTWLTRRKFIRDPAHNASLSKERGG